MAASAEFASAKSLAAAQGEWRSDGWWLRYRDPQLARLIDEALSNSPDLEAAAARMRAAEGFAQRAGAALDPWGTPYFLVRERRSFRVSSAGADRLPNTADDIHSTPEVAADPGSRRR